MRVYFDVVVGDLDKVDEAVAKVLNRSTKRPWTFTVSEAKCETRRQDQTVEKWRVVIVANVDNPADQPGT